MKAARVAAVVAGVEPAERIDFDAERIAAALGEDLKDLLLGMVTPDVLADHLDGRILEAGPSDVRAHGAAVGAVEPAVHAPAQAVRGRVAILQAEALQEHDG